MTRKKKEEKEKRRKKMTTPKYFIHAQKNGSPGLFISNFPACFSEGVLCVVVIPEAVPLQLHSCSPTVHSSPRHRGAPLAHAALPSPFAGSQSFIFDGQAGGKPVSGARRRNAVSSSRNLCRVLGLSTGNADSPLPDFFLHQ